MFHKSTKPEAVFFLSENLQFHAFEMFVLWFHVNRFLFLQVKLLLEQPNIDVNRRNNDRLTSFMLAMQGGPLIGPVDDSWAGWDSSTTHEKLRRLMDLSGTVELENSRYSIF